MPPAEAGATEGVEGVGREVGRGREGGGRECGVRVGERRRRLRSGVGWGGEAQKRGGRW